MKRTAIIIIFLILTLHAVFSQTHSEKQYVIIVSFDGFRWDYPDLGLTPNLKKMAEEGIRAISLQPVFPSKTFPNHFSIATGLYPQNHGLISNLFENPFSGEVYKLADSSAVRNAKWYHGDALWETAKRQGIKTASYFWPGSEMNLEYRRPDYFKRYDHHRPHDDRIQGIIDWLDLPEEHRPQLLFLYFSDTDDKGHRHGPLSVENKNAMKLLDEKLGLLREKLQKTEAADRINLILLSDHGMTQVNLDGLILLYKLLEEIDVKTSGYGPLVQFFVEDKWERKKLYNHLKENESGFKVYLKEDFPRRYSYNKNPFIGDIIALADLHNTFILSAKEHERVKKWKSRGDHGYDNYAMDMQGIFIASGPAFKQGYRCGTLQNIDVYPLVCEILGIVPNQKIDGRLERIKAILK